MYCNFPRKTFDKFFYNSIEYGKHYATFFKVSDGIYVISMRAERSDDYYGAKVLKVIDLYSLEKLEPDYAWKVFEQTLRELDAAEDF